MTATLPHSGLDLDQAGDTFAVKVWIDTEAAPNDGLTEAVARLVLDLHRRRREQAGDESEDKEVA